MWAENKPWRIGTFLLKKTWWSLRGEPEAEEHKKRYSNWNRIVGEQTPFSKDIDTVKNDGVALSKR